MKSNNFNRICAHCYINAAQFHLLGETIPAHSIIYNARNESTIYICTRFPNYEGDSNNVVLRVIWYDYEMHTIGDTFLKGCYASILFDAWVKAGKPKSFRQQCVNYERMMDHPRKKKHGTGGVRLSAKSDEYTTDSLRYKQVTEAAYWENLGNIKSGNASVVASNIR